MQIIKKYHLSTKKQSIEIPIESEILNAVFIENEYSGELNLYTLVNPELETEFRTFYTAYTDHEIPAKRVKFINSVCIENNAAHVFEILEE